MFTGSIGQIYQGRMVRAPLVPMTGPVPSISLAATHNNSWIWAIANSTTTNTITVGGGQTLERSQTDSTNVAQSSM